MNKKMLTLCIVSLFLITAISVVSANEQTVNADGIISKMSIENPEELDQYQNDTQGVPLFVGRDFNINKSYQMAQSFIPTKEILTKVELFIGKNSTTNHSLIVGIRDNLTGENIVEKAVLPKNINTINISNETLNLSWVLIQFNDMFFDLGQAYYIVCYTENITDNWYLWAQNNQSDSYLSGEAYISEDEGGTWTNKSKAKPKPYPQDMYAPLSDDGNNQSDMCFKTYGIDATQLDINFRSIGKGLNTTFENKGSINATGVIFEVTIQGGMLDLIDEKTDGLFINPIAPGESIYVETPVFGLGKVNITANVYAGNAKLVTNTKSGIVIFSYILVLPS